MRDAGYSIAVAPLSKEDGGGYVATVSELPGCMSDGATFEEAWENAQSAISEWIACAERLGRHIPEPTRHLQYA